MENEGEVLQKIGRKLKELRVNAGYNSLEPFVYDHKLPRMQYWRMEAGTANFTMKSLLRVLEVHQLTVKEFFVLIED